MSYREHGTLRHEEAARLTVLTKREAAAYLRVCEKTVENLVKRGVLTAVRVGRSVRFTRVTLDAVLGLSPAPRPSAPVVISRQPPRPVVIPPARPPSTPVSRTPQGAPNSPERRAQLAALCGISVEELERQLGEIRGTRK